MKLFKAFIIAITMFAAVSVGWSQDKVPVDIPKNMTYQFDQASCDLVQFVRLPDGTVRNRPITNAEDTSKASAMACTTKYPLIVSSDTANDRLLIYGNLKNNKSGQREFDLSNDKYLTAAGRELYKNIMSIKVGKLLAIYQAPESYNSITIVAWDQVPWDNDLILPIQSAFEKSAKIDAASD